MIYLQFADGEELDLDCVDSINPGYTAQKTNHEIEDGSEISDNTNVQPDTVEISGFVSNVGLEQTGGFEPEKEGPHTVFHDRVKLAVKSGERVTLVAGVFGVFFDMQIIDFKPSFEAENGSGCAYTLSLEEVRIVNAKIETAKAKPAAQPAQKTDADRFSRQTSAGVSGVMPGTPTAAQAARIEEMMRAGRLSGVF